ncbi:hypothetical protein L228DRAFT_250016 [Xylona heveae TC161]|uniref:HDA1 complex subunit n=1 Tax=Xylona heveae (strain CBS 132557 / TC161) TaxID=1328760 RepID=A0A165AEB8_XYLHT|nr:hypothetical protein L228DRAFT_250016 [Xylona heveae TC161]KZF20337.1 hypothetical protein L228DRAFT_250016 [Xylona heveae TC161]
MDLPRLGQMEFIVSLGMDARARDQYAQTIYNYKDAIEGFAGIRDDEESSEDKSSDDEVLRSGLNPEKSPTSWLPQIKEMLSRAENVVNHNDLDDDGTMTQEHVSPEDEAIWAVQCSTKFEFLKYLLERFRPHEVHLAILAKPGRLLDIIETFLKGLHIVYTRPDTMSRSDATASGYLRVGLLATGETGAAAMVGSADLVIAFDSSFSVHDHQVQGLRSTFFEMHKLSPVIHLTVINSVEHVKRCLPSNVQGIERLQLAVRAITHLRHEAGELSSEFPHTEAAAEKVFEFVDGGSIESEWQLPPLTDVVSMELLAESQSSNSTSRSGTSSEIRQGAQKRPLTTEDEHEPTSTKRIRHSPGAENILSSGIDATHVSESIVEQAETPGQDSSTRNESQKEAELRTIIETAQSRLQEHILALEELQTRHEEQREEIHRLRKEREAVRIAMAQSERRRETQLGEISKLKDEKASLQKELDDARTALANSTVPEIAELETARAEARHNLEAKLHFERKVDSVQRDFEFTRTQYQNASSAAFEASQETASLRDENEALKQKASGEAVKLKQMNAERANSLHLDRISELEATLLERDELIKKKDEDLTRLRGRGGLTTRATSVPRSPRSVSRASSPNPAGIGNGGLGISRATYLRNA